MPLSSLPSTLCMRSRRVGAEGKQGREHEDQLFREEMEMHVRELVLANGGNDLSVLGDAAHKDVGTESVGTQAQIHCVRQAERSLECARNPQEQRWLEGGGYRGRGVLPKSPSCSPLLPSSSPPRSLAIIGAGAGGTALIAALARLLPSRARARPPSIHIFDQTRELGTWHRLPRRTCPRLLKAGEGCDRDTEQ